MCDFELGKGGSDEAIKFPGPCLLAGRGFRNISAVGSRKAWSMQCFPLPRRHEAELASSCQSQAQPIAWRYFSERIDDSPCRTGTPVTLYFPPEPADDVTERKSTGPRCCIRFCCSLCVRGHIGVLNNFGVPNMSPIS